MHPVGKAASEQKPLKIADIRKHSPSHRTHPGATDFFSFLHVHFTYFHIGYLCVSLLLLDLIRHDNVGHLHIRLHTQRFHGKRDHVLSIGRNGRR